MSFDTWREKYYPVTAIAIARDPNATALDLIRHSLQKWRGLQPGVLADHNLDIDDTSYTAHIIDMGNPSPSPSLVVDCHSCALCVRYPSCVNCPFKEVFGAQCDEAINDDRLRYSPNVSLSVSPWDTWSIYTEPDLMIQALTVLEEEYTGTSEEGQLLTSPSE